MNQAEFTAWMRRTPEEKEREARKDRRLSKAQLNAKYGLPAGYKVPTDADIKKAVDLVAPLPAVNTQRGNSQRSGLVKRKGKMILNPCTVYFRPWATYLDMPSRVEDVLIGCCRQSDNATDNTRINPRTVFAVLRSVPYISTESVLQFLNRKRDVLKETGGANQRYAQYVCATCERVIKVFQHHRLFIENIRISHGARVHLFDDATSQEEIELCTLEHYEPYEEDPDNQILSEGIRDNGKISRGVQRQNFGFVRIRDDLPVVGWCVYRGAEQLPCGVHKTSRLLRCNPELFALVWSL